MTVLHATTAPLDDKRHRRARWAAWAVLYALVVLYASTIVSPAGIHFIARDPALALQKFLGMGLGNVASDQRADAMGNLFMMIPFGFLVAASLVPAHGAIRRGCGALAALVLCVGYIVGVKYLQLFFPRTVNLFYIAAQTAGATVGVLGQVLCHDLMRRAGREVRAASHHGLAWLLTAYALGVLVYMMAPFDVVVSRADIADRLASLPTSLLALPGTGRPIYQKVIILVGNVALLAPVGALLHILRPLDPMARIAARGLLLLIGANLLSMGILSTTPSLVSIVLRGFGVVLGVAGMRWLAMRDMPAWRRYLPWLALAAVLPYLVLLLAANGLLRTSWRTPEQALAALDSRLLLPLWSHYIVSKAQAIKSVAVHLAMYAPVGAMIWAGFGHGKVAMTAAALIAFGISLAVEIGRALVPGLAPDPNNAVIAAVAAVLAVGGTRILWMMLESLPRPRPRIVRTWDKRVDQAMPRG